jgi:NAD(P)-dependent dehydrogenase (short-subunit alcohol dehydrogenase family)
MSNQSTETVVITGAGAGVGRAIVDEFANHGARIGLISRNEERLQAAKRYVEERGGKALALPCDTSHADELDRAASRVEEELGSIDIWVNCAMATIFSPVDQITPDEFRRATEVTYLGFVWGTMAALKRMKPRDRGTIVQIGSALAYRSIPLQSAYCGAKHAMVGFTDSVRCELIHDKSNVHLTIVHLPGVNTPQFSWCRSKLPRHPAPLGAVYEPEVPARAVYWAAHHRRREVMVGGPTVEAIYGQEVLPGMGDRYLGRNGYDGQQTDQPVAPDRPDNLFESVPGPYGARGIFSDRAKHFSIQNWANLHRGMVSTASAVLMAAGAGLIWRRSTHAH